MKRRGLRVLGALAIVLVASVSATSSLNAEYNCLPTCGSDARMLSIPSNGIATLAENHLQVHVAAPSETTSLELGIFDGDLGGLWDMRPGDREVTYRLFASPAMSLEGGELIDTWSSAEMPDNEWFTIHIDETTYPGALERARAASGEIFFRFQTTIPFDVKVVNSLKLRVDAAPNGSAVAVMKSNPFGFMVPMRTLADFRAIYKSGEVEPYNGRFPFHFVVPTARRSVEVWDGDMDYGHCDCMVNQNDTDDPNTPNDLIPAWADFAGSPVRPEGVAVSGDPQHGNPPIPCPTGAPLDYTTGDPPDDFFHWSYQGVPEVCRRLPEESDPHFEGTPNVIYELWAPDGYGYLNTNPSGNQEWERFVVTFDEADADVHVTYPDLLPAGIYHIHMHGLDVDNLNAWYFPYDAIGVCEDNEPCYPPLYPGVTATIGYWKTHAEAWPVDELVLGDTTYTRKEALDVLATPARGDKSILLAQQLIAAKLNVAAGSDPSCIGDAVGEADLWLIQVGSVGSGQRQWAGADWLHNELDDYNNGLLCATHRDSIETESVETGKPQGGPPAHKRGAPKGKRGPPSSMGEKGV